MDHSSRHLKLKFVDPGTYIVNDENNFIDLLLQVGSGFNEKSNGSESVKKPTDPDSSSLLELTTIYIIRRTC